MAASRFRAPKEHAPAQRRQPKPGFGKRSKFGPPQTPTEYQREELPVLRVSRTGVCNMPKAKQAALRKERAAPRLRRGKLRLIGLPAAIHAWRRRQWL